MLIQTETGGEAEAAFRKLPADDRGDVVRGVAEGERCDVAEAAVHFGAGGEFLETEDAGLAAAERAKGAGSAERVAEFPWFVAEVLLGDEVF